MSEIRVVGLFRVKDPEIGLPLLQQISGIAAGIGRSPPHSPPESADPRRYRILAESPETC